MYVWVLWSQTVLAAYSFCRENAKRSVYSSFEFNYQKHDHTQTQSVCLSVCLSLSDEHARTHTLTHTESDTRTHTHRRRTCTYTREREREREKREREKRERGGGAQRERENQFIKIHSGIGDFSTYIYYLSNYNKQTAIVSHSSRTLHTRECDFIQHRATLFPVDNESTHKLSHPRNRPIDLKKVSLALSLSLSLSVSCLYVPSYVLS